MVNTIAAYLIKYYPVSPVLLIQGSPDSSSAETFHSTKVAKLLPRNSVAHSAAEVFNIFMASNVKVEIMQGDITEDDSEAIVNTTN